MNNANVSATLLCGSLVLLLTGCGGATAATANHSATVLVQGAYSGTASVQGNPSPMSAFGVASDSSASIDAGGVLYELPSFAEDGSLSGIVTETEPQGQTWPGAAPSMEIAGRGSATSITGTGVQSGDGNVTLSLSSVTLRSPSLSDLATSWTGFEDGLEGAWPHVSITSSGAVTGTDAWGCTLSGTVSPIGDTDLLNADLQDGASTQPSGNCVGMVHGFGFYAGADFLGVGQSGSANGGCCWVAMTGPYLYIEAHSDANAIVLELAKQ